MNYEERIVRHGVIEISSLLELRVETEAFLRKCALADCTVYFVNERITVKPGDDVRNLKVKHIQRDWRQAAEDYVRYITEREKSE